MPDDEQGDFTYTFDEEDVETVVLPDEKRAETATLIGDDGTAGATTSEASSTSVTQEIAEEAETLETEPAEPEPETEPPCFTTLIPCSTSI